jgi:DNA-binding transcriptional regulator GbsR (MarR family)
MNPSVERFIERMGLEAEADGLPRISGRVLGFLITSSNPASLEETAERLHVSRASVSTNCRLLEQLGAAERVTLPGDRKDYYTLAPGFEERFLDATRQSVERKVALAREALAALADDESVARERLVEWLDFHRFILNEINGIAERWKNRASDAPSPPASAPRSPDPS